MTNVEKLTIAFMATLMTPEGSTFASAVMGISESGGLAKARSEAIVLCSQAIDAVICAPDNPYGTDREIVAGVILEEVRKKSSAKVQPSRWSTC